MRALGADEALTPMTPGRARVKGILRRALHRVGVDVIPYDGRRFVARRRMDVIRAAGVSIVLDVGAGGGQFVGWLRGDGYEGRIVSFEPVTEAFASASAPYGRRSLTPARNVALGERDGEAVVNVAGNLWSSSLLPMTPEHEAAAPASAYVGQESVRLARLDSLVSSVPRIVPI